MIICHNVPEICCVMDAIVIEKLKFQNNEKKHLEISSFYTTIPKIMIKCCTAPEIWCMTDVIIFRFGLLFVLPPSHPNSLKSQNFQKNEKSTYHHFTRVYQGWWLDDVLFLRYDLQQTDGRTDRRRDGKSDI